MKKPLLLTALPLAYAALALAWSRIEASDFDRLTDADRSAFNGRFAKELWPLLTRNGKNGCVGCHNGKLVSALEFSGEPSKDFHWLLREGFFDYGDRGSLLGRVTDKDQKRRMPPHPREAWTEEEIEVLRKFTMDVDAKQQK